jgi:molecular chaperone GrpE
MDDGSTGGETERIVDAMTVNVGNGTPGNAIVAELDGLKDTMARLQADFDNYRKRSRKEKEDFANRRVVDTLLAFLEVMDALDRAVETGKDCRDPAKLSRGLELILQQANSILTGLDVRPIEPDGGEFDPALHEAVESVEEKGRPDGTVSATVVKGYRFGETLLRPAKVKVVKNG